MRVSEGFLGRSTVAYDQLFAKELLSGDEVRVWEAVGEETESGGLRPHAGCSSGDIPWWFVAPA